jgi:phosphoglucomutase
MKILVLNAGSSRQKSCGLKAVAPSDWFAARPSGTENFYKIYAESFRDQAHMDAILCDAREMVNNALNPSAPRGVQPKGEP